ncbi:MULTISPECIES: type III pantothenate kinase [Thermocrispum]|jgi:type III pantothenate kinase|uniref:Type III pantothenate kinase n=1 Tax=Thermocrispum agreste TaxID=37925 RepID=A0A2W4J9G9_9PSEU|nr:MULTISPECIES: type III pantothenate kinase [Thermocrispum]PZM94655.1 MAG: type III pantothenate kinase [Thermocrispum agreste]
MLLTVSARDTDLRFGIYEGRGDSARLVRDWRMRTDNRLTADELAWTMRGMLGEYADQITGVSVLSTVPPVRRELRAMLSRYYPDVPRVIIEPGVRTGIPLRVDNPKEVGPDRLMNAMAVHALHPDRPCVVVDFGTATVVDAVSAAGEFLGGAFAPGIEISLDALATRTAALRTVELVRPRSVIGKNTVECLQSGILYGFAGQVDGLVSRVLAEWGTEQGQVAVVATGGLAGLVVAESRTITEHRPDLTLLGLRLAFERNKR